MKRIIKLSYIAVFAVTIFLFSAFINNNKAPRNPIKRLKSDTIHVVNYAIHLDIVQLSNKTIKGYTELKITPKMNNIRFIPLDLLKMTVDSVSVGSTKITSFIYNGSSIRIPLLSPINIHDTVTLKIYYHGKPQVDASGWGGFYFTADSAYAYNLGIGFQAEPHNYGRAWFPCLDDFIDRATYDCYIRVKDTKTAVCDGTLMKETNNHDGTKTFYWRLHSPIPTYLASVAVGNYVPVNYMFKGKKGNIPVMIYVPASDTGKARASFTHLLDILSIYEKYFGPYLWERAGYVGVPFYDGAMEHATNIAYPLTCIDGRLDFEELYAHELSHHWFGDLVTCASEADMWLNEGWASYCESIYREGLYGHSSYAANIKANHYKVLSSCHFDDNGYYAVYGIPSNITYSSTVYKKGADVIHTLRYYLGDTLFFGFIKTWMSTFKFKPMNTFQLRDFITSFTGINMDDFFEGWILTPGFPQYSIDSVKHEGTGNDYTVYVRQKLHHKRDFINSNKIDVTFMDKNWKKYTETIEFSGQYANKLFHLPFTPICTMLDIDEKVSSATTSSYKVIKETGAADFPKSFFAFDVQNASDSAFLRVEYNWVAPDPLKKPAKDIYRISPNGYWKIDGIFPAGFSASGKFQYNSNKSDFDETLLPTAASADSLLLLYRSSTADDWHTVKHSIKGTSSSGYLSVQTLQKGEYTLGIGKPEKQK
ncbi:MAG: M1 family metallopeptidase [Bacteroidales bacterium]